MDTWTGKIRPVRVVAGADIGTVINPDLAAGQIHGGFAMCHFSGEAEVEEQIKQDLQVTVRCIPSDGEAEAGTCPFSGKPSVRRVVFAKAY